MIIVKNKKTGREEALTEEDFENAKKSGLIERFEIIKSVKEQKKTAPLKEVLSFIEASGELKPKHKLKQKKDE
jgi:hypothetical protein